MTPGDGFAAVAVAPLQILNTPDFCLVLFETLCYSLLAALQYYPVDKQHRLHLAEVCWRTRPRQEVFENTSFRFVWALRQSQGFYHIFF